MLGYIGQIVAAPAHFAEVAAVAVERVWHAPHRSMPRAALEPLSFSGAPIPKGLLRRSRILQVFLLPRRAAASDLSTRADG